MSDAHRLARRTTLSVLAIAIAGVAAYACWTQYQTAKPLSAAAQPNPALSEEDIANILKYGKPIQEATPADNMRPDGYDRQVFEVNGARYVIYTGGLSGHHRYGTRLPNK